MHLKNSRRGFTAVELVVVVVVLATVVGVTLVQVDKRMQARLREESAANLKTLYESLTQDIERRGVAPKLPALSSSPGQLAPLASDRRVQKLFACPCFISPAHPKAEQMRREAASNPGAQVADDSYWYLGYALPSEEAGLAFVEAYRKAVEETGKPPTGIIALESPIVVSTYLAKALETGQPISVKLATVSTLFPLLGSSRAFIPLGDHYLYQPLPIFIERPGLQRGGSNVIFQDHHIEFMPYPGKWPMTEKFIKALESLDELKESHADKPEK